MWHRISSWRIGQIPGAYIIWMIVACLGTIVKVVSGPQSYNNFLIFRGVFWHTLAEKSLYLEYPLEYFDTNLYGPVFGVVIAPLALLPTPIGCLFWGILNAGILLYSIHRLPITEPQKIGILLIGLVEMLTSIQNLQFNPMLTSWILLAYVLTRDGKEKWAALFVALGFMVKIYGVIALVCWFFSKRRLVFGGWFIIWLAVLFVIPMVLSSPEFVWDSYGEWMARLASKNEKNRNALANAFMQDISVQGMIRRISGYTFWDGWVLLPAASVYATAFFLNSKRWIHKEFQQRFLAFLLLGVVLFSTSAESATYVIAVVGVGWWYMMETGPRHSWQVVLLLFVLLLTSLSPTDVFPRVVREEWIKPFSLKALPCFLVWLVMVWQFIIWSKTPQDLQE